ncbi:hypothetical protein MCA2328 [Methylococcus capsulatus str. Bath]|uniref:DUF4082 domain-containing protein n=1 Tax=Methylococcus capsulatus (strain ATCC 33009 / NCIMB 11132 / Bath) TaxID=243233 RepID=Q605F6_METCA|nr:hypothetical protein MCA2328 [Methylococcus capsulatus str. Bath]
MPLLASIASVAFIVVQRASATPCPCGVFTAANPTVSTANDAGGLEVGMKFKANTNGYVTGVRFYKYNQSLMGGNHTGSLWDANGNRITSVLFTNETATGWQEATFTSPVSITANTIYTV